MTMYCAICGYRFEGDDDHVWIEAERKHRDYADETDEFALHLGCWDRLSKGWMEPA